MTFEKQFIIVYKNKDGQITKDTIKIEYLTMGDVEEFIGNKETNERFVCLFPLEFIKNNKGVENGI